MGLDSEVWATAWIDGRLTDRDIARPDGLDDDFARPPSAMLPLATPPFYVGEVRQLVSNTQGGPVHDAKQRVLDPFGRAIPGLYAAGELGSAFTHLYMSGGNLAEFFLGGDIAGRNAARGEG